MNRNLFKHHFWFVPKFVLKSGLIDQNFFFIFCQPQNKNIKQQHLQIFITIDEICRSTYFLRFGQTYHHKCDTNLSFDFWTLGDVLWKSASDLKLAGSDFPNLALLLPKPLLLPRLDMFFPSVESRQQTKINFPEAQQHQVPFAFKFMALGQFPLKLILLTTQEVWQPSWL